MKDDKGTSRNFNNEENWVTIKEAIGIIKKELNVNITFGDIYRSALSGIIFLYPKNLKVHDVRSDASAKAVTC